MTELEYHVYSHDQALLLWNENITHPLWTLTGQMAKIPASSNISGIEVWFRLERRPDFYVLTLMVPTLLISITTTLALILPSHSTEKVQTILTSILSYFLLMLNFTQIMPQASESIPILAIFYILIISLGAFASIMCAMIVRLSNAERQERKAKSATLQSAAHGSHTGNARNSLVRSQNPHVTTTRRSAIFRKHTTFLLTLTRMCCGRFGLVTIEQINDTFLYIYIVAISASYAWLLIHMLVVKQMSVQEDAHLYNYTPVQVF